MAIDDELRALATRLQAACLGARVTVGAAESCTGGLVAHALTSVPGSSGYFHGSIVAYANEAKAGLLGVPTEVLAAHGAVSAQAARAMATGARDRLGVDLAVAVTGIAGPGGATPGKPAGLTYVALAGAGDVEVRRFAWTGDRDANVRASALAALELLVAGADALVAQREGGDPPAVSGRAGSDAAGSSRAR